MDGLWDYAKQYTLIVKGDKRSRGSRTSIFGDNTYDEFKYNLEFDWPVPNPKNVGYLGPLTLVEWSD